MRRADHSGMPAARTNHFVINGADGLTYRLAEQLSSRYGSPVVVLMTRQQRGSAATSATCPECGWWSWTASTRGAARGDLAGSGRAGADRPGRCRQYPLALQARDVAPGLRLVVRMYNTNLGHNIEALLGDCKVLSDAEIAAPALVASALGEVAANPVRVGRRTLIVARRADVAPRVVCGLAVTDGHDGPSILPERRRGRSGTGRGRKSNCVGRPRSDRGGKAQTRVLVRPDAHLRAARSPRARPGSR